MGKRTSEAADLPVSKAAATGQETARNPAIDEEMGEFEDRWEDEIESEEEEIVVNDAEADGDGKSPTLLRFVIILTTHRRVYFRPGRL